MKTEKSVEKVLIFDTFLNFLVSKPLSNPRGWWESALFRENSGVSGGVKSGQNGPVKNAIFVQNAYLILIVFHQNPVFDVFAEKPLILDTFWHHCGTTVLFLKFSPKPLSKPRGWCRNEQNMKITEKHWKSLKMSKMSPTNLTSQKTVKKCKIHCFLVKKYKKCQKTPRRNGTTDTTPPIDAENPKITENQWKSVKIRVLEVPDPLQWGNSGKEVPDPLQWDYSGDYSGDTVQTRTRTHTTGVPTRSAPCPHTPYPGYPTTSPPLLALPDR